ncbi:unnamed protein product [Sphenostylis stenocarpa]|uniref:Uncharacterized protein n=1 Tax=Sphenostylis stenocarpa TaxID=92480 RepID=A0AA86VTG4_9FABA|nr:unnamed protein product [Sphenostylis stenocarpa]
MGGDIYRKGTSEFKQANQSREMFMKFTLWTCDVGGFSANLVEVVTTCDKGRSLLPTSQIDLSLHKARAIGNINSNTCIDGAEDIYE